MRNVPYTVIGVLLLTRVAIIHAAPAELDPMVVGAYYYPWYGEFPGGHNFRETLRDHLVPQQSPALGHYSARVSDTMASHLDQSHEGNISFWALSWWGPKSAEDETIRNSIFAHPRSDELKYAIHYESTGRFGPFADPDYSVLLPDFRYLAENYFADEKYLRINGAPVVFIYLTRAYFNSQASRDAITSVRQSIRDEFGYDLYLIGDDFFTSNVNTFRAGLWDAITAFDVYGMVLQGGGSTRNALAVLANIYDQAQSVATTLGIGFIPTAAPGFNDRGVRSGHTAAPRYFQDEDNSEEGSLFCQMLADVVVPRVDPVAQNILMINSFNEWHEDTQIEPTNIAPPTDQDDKGQFYTQGYSYTGYGDLYLQILSENTLPPEPEDCDADGVPDECEIDCGSPGGECDLPGCGAASDCNGNGTPDECELSGNDCNANGLPDECDADCQPNGVPDDCDLTDGTSPDCQPNGIPDECDLASGNSPDENNDGVPDECCEQNSDCDDMNPCSFDRCLDRLCSHDLDARYGDVAGDAGACGPNGDVALSDILSVLNGFAGQFADGCELVNIDIAGDQASCEPNSSIDLSDILAVLDAFQGLDRCCAATRE